MNHFELLSPLEPAEVRISGYELNDLRFAGRVSGSVTVPGLSKSVEVRFTAMPEGSEEWISAALAERQLLTRDRVLHHLQSDIEAQDVVAEVA